MATAGVVADGVWQRKYKDAAESKRAWCMRHRDKVRANNRAWRKRNSAWCRTNTRTSQVRRRGQIQMFIRWLKEEPCLDCRERRPLRQMHFHHRAGTVKLFCLGGNGVGSRTWTALFRELRKCDLLCRDCHQRRHKEAA
jgi:hypothetical protein